MKIATVEANIGAGKTTVLRALQFEKDADTLLVEEPVDEWRTHVPELGTSIFNAYYQNPTKYSTVFQMYVMMSRVRNLRRAIAEFERDRGRRPRLVIMERSVFADREIFMRHLHTGGHVDGVEMHIYDDLFRYMLEHECMLQPMQEADTVVYLRCDAARCHERVRRRARDAEVDAVSREFLEALHEKHETWLMHNPGPLHVIVIDNNHAADDILAWSREKAREILRALE